MFVGFIEICAELKNIELREIIVICNLFGQQLDLINETIYFVSTHNHVFVF